MMAAPLFIVCCGHRRHQLICMLVDLLHIAHIRIAYICDLHDRNICDDIDEEG